MTVGVHLRRAHTMTGNHSYAAREEHSGESSKHWTEIVEEHSGEDYPVMFRKLTIPDVLEAVRYWQQAPYEFLLVARDPKAWDRASFALQVAGQVLRVAAIEERLGDDAPLPASVASLYRAAIYWRIKNSGWIRKEKRKGGKHGIGQGKIKGDKGKANRRMVADKGKRPHPGDIDTLLKNLEGDTGAIETFVAYEQTLVKSQAEGLALKTEEGLFVRACEVVSTLKHVYANRPTSRDDRSVPGTRSDDAKQPHRVSAGAEQPWDKDDDDYIPAAEALRRIGSPIDQSTLSKMLTPDGKIRYMRLRGKGGKTGRCRVHGADFMRYGPKVPDGDSFTDETVDEYVDGVEQRKQIARRRKEAGE